ncbi:MAG TPA: hypothetical protein EYH41_04375 [Novosphingobium capsulatum]|nr:hypothetical protein [Novosphingobium capsulatum]
MSEETIQADAAALVAMPVALLAAHLDGVDLDTLNAALEAEQAGPNRKGAIAALGAAISGHPEGAAAAAKAAEGAPSDAPGAPPSSNPAVDGSEADSELLTAGGSITVALADAPADPDAISVAPPRPHESLVSQLALRWHEFKDFVRGLEGEVEGELGAALAFARSHL